MQLIRLFRALWYILRIRFTTSGWFITNRTLIGHVPGCFWTDGLIRRPVPGRDALECPLQSIGLPLRLNNYRYVGAAADIPSYWFRPALLWATRLKEA